MNAYYKYWIPTALLLSAIVVAFFVSAEMQEDSAAILKNPQVIGASIFMMLVFIVCYVRAHNVALRLAYDEASVMKLQLLFSRCGEDLHSEQKIVAQVTAGEGIGHRKSRIRTMLLSLGTRFSVAKRHFVAEPINQDAFHGDVEAGINGDIEQLDSMQMLLFLLGFLGTVAGILWALVGQSSPVTAAEVEQFNFRMLSGMGTAYVTSVFGLGGGTLLFILKTFVFEVHARSISTCFRKIAFEVIFPVLQGNGRLSQENGDEQAT